MRDYSAVGDQTIASPTDTALTLQSTTADRPLLWDVLISFDAAADNQIQILAQMFDTDDGTGTAVTPTPTDNGDPASSITVQDNHTTEPSSYLSGEIQLNMFVNQRSTHRFPFNFGRGIKLPAVATEGIGFQPVHASATPDVAVQVWWTE